MSSAGNQMIFGFALGLPLFLSGCGASTQLKELTLVKVAAEQILALLKFQLCLEAYFNPLER